MITIYPSIHYLQVVNLQTELSYMQAHLSALELPTPVPVLSQPQQLFIPPAQSMLDFPTNIPAAYDFSSLSDTVVPSWNHYQRQQQIENFSNSTARGPPDGDLQELARELLARHVPPPTMGMGCRNQASAFRPN